MLLKKSSVARRSRLSVLGLSLCSALVLPAQLSVRAESVTLTWNPSVATNVAGYKVYAGTTSHAYSTTNMTGTATNTTIAGLAQGKTYYFAATTYDSAGNESTFSSEASYTVPVTPVTPATLDTPTQAGGQFSFAVSGVNGAQYVVQASTNMVNWVSLQTNTAPFTFVDTNAASFNQRYYRTYSLVP